MLKVAIFFLAVFGISIALAQSPILSASTDELIDKLNPNSITNPPAIRSRGLRNLTPEVSEKPSIELVIQFEFNSSDLLPDSKPLLDNLAKALNSDQLRNFPFIVEGHTDAVGKPAYNLKLSNQRAKSVLFYLVAKGVSRNRLKATGMGANELLFPDKPDAEENRRVKITLSQ